MGTDLSLLENRLTFTADYFEKTRTNMLLTLPLAGISGLTETVDNVGELLNKGFEFSTNYRRATGKFTYDLGVNFTTYKNEVVDLDILDEIIASTYSGSGAVALIRVGQPLGVFYGLVTDGLFQTPDDVQQPTRSTATKAPPTNWHGPRRF